MGSLCSFLVNNHIRRLCLNYNMTSLLNLKGGSETLKNLLRLVRSINIRVFLCITLTPPAGCLLDLHSALSNFQVLAVVNINNV